MLIAFGPATPVSAQVEDTFSQFEARCLTPMLEVRDADVTGLIFAMEVAGQEKWFGASQEWWLLRPASDEGVNFCAIHGDFGEDADVWAEAAVASGAFIRLDRDRETLQSVFLREPRIEVVLDRTTAPMRLTVIETELES